MENEEKIIEETKRLVTYFLLTHLSDNDLAQKFNMSPATVGRRLTNKENIIKAFGEKGEINYEKVMAIRQRNLHVGKIIGGQTSQAKFNPENEKNDTKCLLDVFAKKPEHQLMFLKHIALKFKLHAETIQEIFGFDAENIKKQLTKNAEDMYESINFLLTYDQTNQAKAKANFMKFYNDYIVAISNKNREKIQELYEVISDVKVKVYLNREPSMKVSRDMIVTIIEYQLKYALRSNAVAKMFDINYKNYVERVNDYFENDPDFRKAYYDSYQDLANFYSKRFLKNSAIYENGIKR